MKLHLRFFDEQDGVAGKSRLERLRAVSVLAVLGVFAWLASGAPSVWGMIVVINEIHYHPSAAQGDIEFIELYNDTTVPENLAGWRFTKGIAFVFPPDTWIAPHGYLVLASNPAAFRAAYPTVPVAGQYAGRLDNAGETIELRNAFGAIVDSVDYDDRRPWPKAADGTGHSLSLLHPYLANERAESWAISIRIGGTPGAANFPSPPPAPSVVISEIMSNPTSGTPWIELHNSTSAPVQLAGYCISNDNDNLSKHRIGNRTLAAGEYAVLDAAELGFALNAAGGAVYLTDLARQQVVDAATYEPTELGHSRGRFFDRRNHKEHWCYLTQPTPGAANIAALNDSIVINEVMYHPFAGRPSREYVELYNRGTATVNLSGWRLTDAIRFEFPEGTKIAAGGYLVVAESTATLASIYSLLPAQLVGNFRGNLNDSHDRIVLLDAKGNPADEVEYYDGGRWPEWADGLGSSLELIDPNQTNDFPSVWAPSDDADKAQWTYVEYTKRQVGSDVPFESEFHILLTDTGSVLVDDLQLRATDTSETLLDNGNFESGRQGWKCEGTHRCSTAVSGAGRVYSGSQALQIIASGRGTEGFNGIERDTRIPLVADAFYTVSYWAKWVVGCNQLLTRTHYQGVAQTTALPVPERLGTPGARNSRYLPNFGPIIANVKHRPVVPRSNEMVVVTALLLDSQGVANATLYYKADCASEWQSAPMADDGAHGDGAAGDDIYGALIPPHPHNTLVEFYILARDAWAWWQPFPTSDPATDPPPRRALYHVRDTSHTTTLKSFQLLINDDHAARLAERPRLDNEWLDATFVLDDQFVFYNIGFRYKGSGYTRPYGLATRPSYRLRFNSDEPLFGLVAVNVDNLQANALWGLNNLMVQWLLAQMGVPVSSHECVRMFRHCSADPDRDHGVYNHFTRVDDAWLESRFPGGDQGFLYEVEDHFEWSDIGALSRRIPDDTARLKYLGPDEEAYRWNFHPQSRELEDNFEPLQALARLMDPDVTDDASFTAHVEQAVEVDQWLRKWAVSAVCDDWDTLGMDFENNPRGKNAYLYQRSDTGRWVLLPWDHDSIFTAPDRPIVPRWWFDGERRLMTHPVFGRRYLQYIYQLATGPFSAPQWDARLRILGAAYAPEHDVACTTKPLKDGADFRRQWLLTRALPISAPFEITTNAGAGFAVDTPTVALRGTAPLEVFSLRVNGAPAANVRWLDSRTWQIPAIPVVRGPNVITVAGVREDGTVAASDSITVTRYTGLRVLPYATSFEGDEVPAFRSGDLPQNYWEGSAFIGQTNRASHGSRALYLSNGWAQQTFDAGGQSRVWIETAICTAGSTEPAAISEDAGEFAAQLYFSRAEGLLALDGNGRGGGVWRATGTMLDTDQTVRVGISLDFTSQRWHLLVNGRLVFSGLGFAWPRTQYSFFRGYSDGPAWLDELFAGPAPGVPAKPCLVFEPSWTRGTENNVRWGTLPGVAAYYLEWSKQASFSAVAGSSGWQASTDYTARDLQDGQIYYYRVKARNEGGVEGPWSDLVSSRQDASPPESRLTPIHPAATSSSVVTLYCEASDAVSGVQEVRLYWRHNHTGSYSQWPVAFSNNRLEFNTNMACGSGTYELYSIALDKVGNVEPPPDSPDVVIQITGPAGVGRWMHYR